MSWWVGIKTKNIWDKWQDLDEINVTYNLSKMFKALPCGHPKLWEGKNAKEILPLIMDSFIEIDLNSEKYRIFEDPGGWGTVKSMRKFLVNLSGLCMKYPYGTIYVN